MPTPCISPAGPAGPDNTPLATTCHCALTRGKRTHTSAQSDLMQLNASQLSPGTQPPAPHCSARTRNSLQRNSHLTVHLPCDCDHAVQPGIHAHVCHAASAPGPPAAHAARLAAAVANAMASTPLYSNPGHSTAAHDWGAPATAQLLLLLAALLATLPTRLLEAPH